MEVAIRKIAEALERIAGALERLADKKPLARDDDDVSSWPERTKPKE